MDELEHIFPFKCQYVYWSDDKQFCTVKVQDKGWCVINHAGKIIVDFGIFTQIDGYTRGYARVRKGAKYGVIDTKGAEKMPVEFDFIWNFYNRTYPFIKAYKYSREYRKSRYKKELPELLKTGKIKKYDDDETQEMWIIPEKERIEFVKRNKQYYELKEMGLIPDVAGDER